MLLFVIIFKQSEWVIFLWIQVQMYCFPGLTNIMNILFSRKLVLSLAIYFPLGPVKMTDYICATFNFWFWGANPSLLRACFRLCTERSFLAERRLVSGYQGSNKVLPHWRQSTLPTVTPTLCQLYSCILLSNILFMYCFKSYFDSIV